MAFEYVAPTEGLVSYGDRYFPYQIWTPGEDTGRELPRSRAEREFTRNLAWNEAQPETVTLALF